MLDSCDDVSKQPCRHYLAISNHDHPDCRFSKNKRKALCSQAHLRIEWRCKKKKKSNEEGKDYPTSKPKHDFFFLPFSLFLPCHTIFHCSCWPNLSSESISKLIYLNAREELNAEPVTVSKKSRRIVGKKKKSQHKRTQSMIGEIGKCGQRRMFSLPLAPRLQRTSN